MCPKVTRVRFFRRITEASKSNAKTHKKGKCQNAKYEGCSEKGVGLPGLRGGIENPKWDFLNVVTGWGQFLMLLVVGTSDRLNNKYLVEAKYLFGFKYQIEIYWPNIKKQKWPKI